MPSTAMPAALKPLPPEMRARLLYQDARGAAADQLWQAASATDGATGGQAPVKGASDVDHKSFLALWDNISNRGVPGQGLAPTAASPRNDPFEEQDAAQRQAHAHPDEAHGSDGYQDIIASAAERTGIPATALAAIIDAEAAKGADGRWLALSRNPRSSAAGLGQFLSGTWKDEAERSGTWLNQLATTNGWLNERGKIRGDAKSALLATRYDPRASIEAVADYALANLARLRQAGITIGTAPSDVARTAYFAHHLGVADTIDFLNGRMSEGRAHRLLAAQIGADAAARRIEESGDAVAAHRGWLMQFVATRVRPDRFTALHSA